MQTKEFKKNTKRKFEKRIHVRGKQEKKREEEEETEMTEVPEAEGWRVGGGGVGQGRWQGDEG